MILTDITTFVGRFHPLIVHMPIGIFILAFLIDLISYHPKFSQYRQAVPLIMLIGFVFSILAVILGYLLSFTGEYDRNTLQAHQFAGILLTLLTGALCLMQLPRFKEWITVPTKLYSFFILVMLVFVIYTGHQGASLTHGNDYINMKVLNDSKRVKPQNINEVMLYEDVVEPILSKKCMQCHRKGKKKGRLSVESIAEMKKGGKTGAGIVAGNAAESEMIKRILLDPSHEDFMPADGKTPLTKDETAILKWWVEKGMDSTEQRLLLHKDAREMTTAVGSFLQISDQGKNDGPNGQQIDKDIPDTINMKAVENLRARGANVRIMFRQPVMLDISFPSGSKDKVLAAVNDLDDVALHVIWLNVSGNGLTEADLKFLPSMKNLVKLRLENNDISGEKICALLLPLTKLEAVNLNDTKVSGECIAKIAAMPAMKNVYSWQSTKKVK